MNNQSQNRAIENGIADLERRLEDLKLQFNLYFSGERRTPPENERAILEKAVQQISFRSDRSPRISLLIQNLTQKFTLYNNMWLKRLNNVEMGLPIIRRETGKTSEEFTPPPPQEKPAKKKMVTVNLEDTGSFDKLMNQFSERLPDKFKTGSGKDNFIKALKQKMEKGNISEARMSLDFKDGKIKVKIS